MPTFDTVYNRTFTSNNPVAGRVSFDDTGVSFTGSRKSFLLKNIPVEFSITADQITAIIPRRPNKLIVVTDSQKYQFEVGTTFFNSAMPGMETLPSVGIIQTQVIKAAVARGNETILAQVVKEIDQSGLASLIQPTQNGFGGARAQYVYVAVAVVFVLSIVIWAVNTLYKIAQFRSTLP